MYNLKRRMASLPPISADEYAESIATSLVLGKGETSSPSTDPAAKKPSPSMVGDADDVEVEQSTDEENQIERCMFCLEVLDSQGSNLEHMFLKHSFHVPEIEHLSSLETFIRYLRKIITEYHECLYCGVTKDSSAGIRRHMLDKDHCMINLKREPELLEFWELSDSEEHISSDEYGPGSREVEAEPTLTHDVSQGELTLPSGKIAISKSKAREARLLARRAASQANEATDRTCDKSINGINSPESASMRSDLMKADAKEKPRDLTVTKRDAAGLIGVSNQQVRSLVTVHRKMQRQEAVVRASAAWADELGGRSQKHGKVKMDLRSG